MKRLALRRTTLRKLSTSGLGRVRGGALPSYVCQQDCTRAASGCERSLMTEGCDENENEGTIWCDSAGMQPDPY